MKVIDRLKRFIVKNNVSVLKISKEVNISPYTLYKWIGKNDIPKHEQAIIIEKWLDENEGVNTDSIASEPSPDYNKPDFQALYIEQLKKNEDALRENIRLLEEQLRLANEKAGISLDYMTEAMHAQLAHQKASAWYQAYQASGGNEKKLKEELERISNKTAEYAGLHSNKGKNVNS